MELRSNTAKACALQQQSGFEARGVNAHDVNAHDVNVWDMSVLDTQLMI